MTQDVIASDLVSYTQDRLIAYFSGTAGFWSGQAQCEDDVVGCRGGPESYAKYTSAERSPIASRERTHGTWWLVNTKVSTAEKGLC